MRVIAGTARHLKLKTIEGINTRPTTDRIKETLFNMLAPYVQGARFLDLFAGSGAIGIEALSRGAHEAVFVEKNRRAVQCIRENLEFTRLSKEAEVLQEDVFAALERLERRAGELSISRDGGRPYIFDVVFLDPPYNCLLEKQVLEVLAHSCLIDGDSLIVAEASLQTAFDYLEALGFEQIKLKKYKTNVHLFCRRA